jgi:hypothetical protein
MPYVRHGHLQKMKVRRDISVGRPRKRRVHMFSIPNTKSISTRRGVRLGVIAASASALLVVATAGTASADPVTDTGSTTANVAVNSSITLTGLTPSFTLTGMPGDVVTADEAVGFTVETNNLAGYNVTVRSATATLVHTALGNADYIPIGALEVRETNLATPGAFTPVLSTGTVTVHSQSTRSAEGGDELSNDYKVTIPFVNQDTYSATLNYVAGTL